MGACVLSVGAGGALRADSYPSRPVTLIAPWPAGGAIDALGRELASRLTSRLGQSVVVENRPGAASTLGVAAVARANADGYTLVLAGSGSLAIAASVFKKLPYDPAKDFAPIAIVAEVPFVLLANPSLPVSSLAELIKLAKEKPRQLNYASGGPGSPHHLFFEMLKGETGMELTHVPYKGGAPALNDLVGGHIHVMFSDLQALPQVAAGAVRAFGVSSGRRWPTAREIPTVAEAGVPGFEAVAWSMVVAPAGTPPPITARLHAELKQIMAVSEVQQQMIKLGMLPVVSPSRETLQGYINSEIQRWGRIVRQAGLESSQ